MFPSEYATEECGETHVLITSRLCEGRARHAFQCQHVEVGLAITC